MALVVSVTNFGQAAAAASSCPAGTAYTKTRVVRKAQFEVARSQFDEGIVHQIGLADSRRVRPVYKAVFAAVRHDGCDAAVGLFEQIAVVEEQPLVAEGFVVIAG